MHGTPELDRLSHGALARILVGNVCLDDMRDPAFLINHPLRLLCPFHVEIDQRDLGPVTREQDGAGATVADLA